MDRTKLRSELVRDEGLRLTPYRDTNGFFTIGIGHLLGGHPRMTLITVAEANALYDVDVFAAEILARQCVPMFDALSDVRQRALVNMAFNRGNHMRDSSTITPAINVAAQTGRSEDWAKVSVAIAGSPWAKQVGLRATRLAFMLETGGTS